ncbi:MAG: Na+/H+ antiporter, partial [Solirubrobacterales bacterium]|nr:Na+/H+ antiporter [Solirubrobacterales bacterium]
MPRIDLLVGLLVATVPLVAFARRINVPYPVVLVLGGVAFSFVPGLPQVDLRPGLVFLV